MQRDYDHNLIERLQFAGMYAAEGQADTARAIALLAVLGLNDDYKQRQAVLEVLPEIKRMVESRHAAPPVDRRRKR